MTRQEAIEIYKERSAKFKNTQSVQWKMNISIWSLFALSIYHKRQMNFPTCEGCCIKWGCILEIIIGILVIFIHGFFCYKIQKSLDSDKKIKHSIAQQLNASVDDLLNVQVDLEVVSTRSPWAWVILQISITIILALVFCISS